jgi:hypothetical protein
MTTRCPVRGALSDLLVVPAEFARNRRGREPREEFGGSFLSRKLHLDLADRVREIREVLHGEDGAQAMADRLGIPLKTWLHYESGVVMPGKIALMLIVSADVSPRWLLDGEGEKFTR